MHDDGLTEAQQAFLRAQEHHDIMSHFTAQELDSMSLDEYARLTGRQLVVQPVAVPTAPPGSPRQATHPAPQPQGIDVSGLSMSDYEQVRGQLGMGAGREYGRGVLDAGSAGAWQAAARSKAGRSALITSNVVEPPRIERVMLRDDRRGHQSARDRFSTPGNANSF